MVLGHLIILVRNQIEAQLKMRTKVIGFQLNGALKKVFGLLVFPT